MGVGGNRAGKGSQNFPKSSKKEKNERGLKNLPKEDPKVMNMKVLGGFGSKTEGIWVKPKQEA